MSASCQRNITISARQLMNISIWLIATIQRNNSAVCSIGTGLRYCFVFNWLFLKFKWCQKYELRAARIYNLILKMGNTQIVECISIYQLILGTFNELNLDIHGLFDLLLQIRKQPCTHYDLSFLNLGTEYVLLLPSASKWHQDVFIQYPKTFRLQNN